MWQDVRAGYEKVLRKRVLVCWVLAQWWDECSTSVKTWVRVLHSRERLAVVVLRCNPVLSEGRDRWTRSLTCWCFLNVWRSTVSKSTVENSKRRQLPLPFTHTCSAPHLMYTDTDERMWTAYGCQRFDSLFRFHYFTLGNTVVYTSITKAVPSAYSVL